MDNIISCMARLQEEGKSFVLCIITRTLGSVPRKQGSKMLVTGEGVLMGSVGGGAMEQEVTADAMKLLQNNQPLEKTYRRNSDENKDQMAEVTLYMESFAPSARLYIFGAGHVGSAIARKVAGMDFQIHIIDPRKELLEKIPQTLAKTRHEDYVSAAREITLTPSDFIVITTHSHESDRQVLGLMASSRAAYIGMIGSRKKVEETRRYIVDNQLATPEQLDTVDMPMGIPIGAQSPEEIAISVLARIIEVKNRPKVK